MPMSLTIRQRLKLDLSRFIGWDYPTNCELARTQQWYELLTAMHGCNRRAEV